MAPLDVSIGPATAPIGLFIVLVVALVGTNCGGVESPTTPTLPTPTPSPSPTPATVPSSADWVLVFEDEFELPGSPDPARWGYEIGYVRNNELQYYSSRTENARVEDGNLVIEARREPYLGHAYTSASLNTKERAHFLYGRLEIRAQLPTGRGTWPAIWMLGTNIDQVGWPACGEIDIMEYVGFDPLRIFGNINTAAYNHTIGTSRGVASRSRRPGNPSTSTHWSGTPIASISSWTRRRTSPSETRGPETPSGPSTSRTTYCSTSPSAEVGEGSKA